MKRRPRITIRAMLLVLVLLGVGVVVALSAAGFHSNGQLIESQNRLVEVMLPLQDASREIETVVRGFILHQARIEAAPGLGELDVLACRTPLEAAFQKARERIEGLGDQAPDSGPGIRKLTELYGPFLEKEDRLEALKRDSLGLERTVNARMDRLDAVVKDLQDNAEAVSGKVNFAGLKDIMALKRQLALSGDPEGLRAAAAALVDNDLARTQKTTSDLSLAVADLATHGRLLVLCRTPDQLQSIRANRIAQAVRLMVVSLESLAGRVNGNGELAGIIQKLNTDAAEVQSVLLQADDSIAALASRRLDNQKQMAEIRAGFEKDAAGMNRQVASLASLSARLLREAKDQNEMVREDTARFVGSISALAVVFLFVSGWWITRRISVPVGKASRFADVLAQGDFTAEIELSSNDEMGDLVHKLRMMAESLNELLIQVTQAGIQVASSSMELAATAKEQEATVRHQVESTGKVEESVERISGVMGDLVRTMEQMTVASQESEWKKDGMGDLARMEQAMRNMDAASKAISVKLAAISEKMENITSVVTTITKVAEQTNLLSLNAAIEAEKAGEFGRGFTVVAREIRRLADQTAVATLDIDNMVKDMRGAVTTGVMEMDSFISNVAHSAEDIGRISHRVSRIITKVQDVAPSLEQVGLAMSGLAEETQMTQDSLSESYSAIEQLNEAAKNLQSEVSRFKLVQKEPGGEPR